MSSVLTQTVSGTPIPATCDPVTSPSTAVFAGWAGIYEREITWSQGGEGCPLGYYISATSAGGLVGGSCVYYTGPGAYPKTYTGYCSIVVYTTSTMDMVAATTTVAPPDATSSTETYVTVTQTNLVTSTSTYVEMPGAARIAGEEKRGFGHNSTWTEPESLRGSLDKRQNVQPPTGSFTSYFENGDSECSWLNGNFVTCGYGCCDEGNYCLPAHFGCCTDFSCLDIDLYAFLTTFSSVMVTTGVTSSLYIETNLYTDTVTALQLTDVYTVTSTTVTTIESTTTVVETSTADAATQPFSSDTTLAATSSASDVGMGSTDTATDGPATVTVTSGPTTDASLTSAAATTTTSQGEGFAARWKPQSKANMILLLGVVVAFMTIS